jgi:hypothetical protein
MEQKLTTYVEFSEGQTAKEAVRALKSAGFDDIEIEDLNHALQMATDIGDPPAKMTWIYSLAGLCLGAILGVGWGLLVFGLPAQVLGMHYADAIAIIGTILCVGAGAVVGMEQGYVFAGRHSPDPTSVLDGHPVGVHVSAENGDRMIRAKEILARFIEPSPRQRRWWNHRRWARQIGQIGT